MNILDCIKFIVDINYDINTYYFGVLNWVYFFDYYYLFQNYDIKDGLRRATESERPSPCTREEKYLSKLRSLELIVDG